MEKKCSWCLSWRMARWVSLCPVLPGWTTELCRNTDRVGGCKQTKTVETSQAELQVDNNSNLPPLMNPAMLEASEDLTNLSHLNEPAGSSR